MMIDARPLPAVAGSGRDSRRDNAVWLHAVRLLLQPSLLFLLDCNQRVVVREMLQIKVNIIARRFEQ
jgi:hypothetical protein